MSCCYEATVDGCLATAETMTSLADDAGWVWSLQLPPVGGELHLEHQCPPLGTLVPHTNPLPSPPGSKNGEWRMENGD